MIPITGQPSATSAALSFVRLCRIHAVANALSVPMVVAIVGSLCPISCSHAVTHMHKHLGMPVHSAYTLNSSYANSGSHMAQFPEKIDCIHIVVKQLPSCEHSAKMPCYQNPSTYVCKERCGRQHSCCSRSCSANCGACQRLNTVPEGQVEVPRILHSPHPCDRHLFCGHACKDDCVEGHVCSGKCNGTCRQTCPHNECRKGCSIPCDPCIKKCPWICLHLSCPATCGMVRRCGEMLTSGETNLVTTGMYSSPLRQKV